MHKNINWLFNLQLFAGEGGAPSGGEGGDGTAATGAENADAAGLQRSRELGVPEAKITKRAKKLSAAMSASAQPAEAPKEEEPATEEVAEESSEKPEETPARLTWDEIMADPEYNKKMQETVSSRLKKSRAAEEALNKLRPALEELGAHYGIDVSDINKLDVDGLAKAITEDKALYENRAIETGRSVEDVMRESAQKRTNNELIEANIRRHFAGLREQEQSLRQEYPDFSLDAELADPAFARMVAPNVGVPLKTAYEAKYHKKIVDQATAKVRQEEAAKVASSIAAGKSRPVENGGTDAKAAPVPQVMPNNKEYREQLKKQLAREGTLPLRGVVYR